MDTNQLKFLMYRSVDGDVSVNAIIKDETIWLTQKAMAEYEEFNKTQRIESDFDKEVKKMIGTKKD